MEEFESKFSQIASIIGDKARSVILWNLLDGRAYTATELATSANISLQSTSNHLSKMIKANILSVEKQGRHRYYNYASAEVAQVIESMASLVPLSEAYTKIKKPKANDFTYARTCYDHIAGCVGVKITNSLIDHKILEISEKKYIVTDYGKEWFQKIDIDTNLIKLQKRSFAHQCLDWSERKHHLAGALGASLLEIMIKKDWIRKKKNSRELIITSIGKTALKDTLNLEI
ncbi:ArsR family transcriptional regulator [Tenacibaculum adriaticum]|uniref:ArsR family transcriptional regulator n=1 Tax=Tenacibaculum adriaticum TaxID=413713 RepID=A0A5S5DXB1_9FLAO|nr:winged helix-turn-helix domain-containing protein [Tenacibaculum adriaticum]TYP99432.1 ArsR family transcriptional regulator [Tenacibaculum adriaticum]